MPYFKKNGEQLEATLFDSIELGTADTDVKLFTTPVGGAKKEWHTNMKNSGKLEDNQEFLIKAFVLHTPPDITKAQMIALLKEGWMKLVIGQKPYMELPIARLTSGGGVDGLTTATAAELYHPGVADPRAIFTLNDGILIENGQNFSVDFEWGTAPAASGAFRFYLDMDGIQNRNIQ